MTNTNISFRVFVSSFTFLMLFVSTALLSAQELPEKADLLDVYSMSLDELMNVQVSIASQFLEQDLVVGSSVARIDPEHWNRLGARLMTDALINQTSIMVYPRLGGENAIFIRGYTGNPTGIATMIDGVPVVSIRAGSSEFLPGIGLGTLNEIEIIKGPGSAIYGSDAFHGVVAYETFSSDEDYYYAQASGAYPFYGDVSMNVSHGLADGRVRIDMASSLAAQDALDLEFPFKHDSYQFAVGYPLQAAAEGTGLRENKYQNQTSIFKLTVTPEERTRIRLGTYLVRNKFYRFPGIVKSEAGYLDENDVSSRESLFLMGTGAVSYRFDNDIFLESSGYYWWDEGPFSTNVMNTGQYAYSRRYVGGEYQASMDLTCKQRDNAIGLQWLLTYSFTRKKVHAAKTLRYHTYTYQMTKPPLNENYDGFERDIHSLYGQAKYGVLSDRLYLLAGGRFDSYSDFGEQFTPRVGLIYLPVERLSLKALYGRAFRAPIAKEMDGVKDNIERNPDIKPEIIDVYELIFMYEHERLKASVNGFYSYWKDGIIQKDTASGTPPIIYENEGKNQSYGAELSLLYSLEPTALELGFSYVKSRALDVHRDYDAYPEYFINTGIYYSIERLGVNIYLNNRLYLNMKETLWVKNHDANELPTYWRTDLNVNKKITERAEIILDIRNLFDRENSIPSLFGAQNGIEEPGISALLRFCYEL